MIPLTDEENKFCEEQETCHICEGMFCTDEDHENYKNRKKVKDHCHYTGKYRGAAHSVCNLNYKVPKNIPKVIHNASYDTHFIINQLVKKIKGELDCNISLFLRKFKKKKKKNAMMVKQFHVN